MKTNKVLYEIKTLNNLIKRKVGKSLGEHHMDELTMAHGWILKYINNSSEDVFQKNIEQHFMIRRSTATQMLNLLEKKEMITRTSVEYDARLKKLTLTPKAKECELKVNEQMIKIENQISSDIPKEDIEVFLRVIKQMKDNINKGK